jgi:hypothetical protein
MQHEITFSWLICAIMVRMERRQMLSGVASPATSPQRAACSVSRDLAAKCAFGQNNEFAVLVEIQHVRILG